MLIPALAAFGTCVYRIGGASFWQDEAATLAAVHRSLPQLLAMLTHVDAVHGLYDVLVWFVVRVAGTSEFAVRLPSAVAVAVAAGMVTALGRRLVSTQAGLSAGLLLAALPAVIGIGQTARSYALVMALATVASYVLVRVLDCEVAERLGTDPAAHLAARRRWLVWYAVAIAALGLANLFALLIVPAHAVALLARRGPIKGWLAAVAVAGLVVAPVAVIGWGQRGQIGWVKLVTIARIGQLSQLAGPSLLAGLLALAIAAGVVVSLARGRLRTDWPPALTALSVSWLLVPPAILLAAGTVFGVYLIRYVEFCVPAAVLLAGAGLAALGRVIGVLALAVVVLLALPQPGLLGGWGPQYASLRLLSHRLAEQAKPGDAMYYITPRRTQDVRVYCYAYPAGYRGLRDIGLGRTAVASATLAGTNAPARVVRLRLAGGGITRVWVVAKSPAPVRLLRSLGFHQVSSWRSLRVWLLLYTRSPARAVADGLILPPRYGIMVGCQ